MENKAHQILVWIFRVLVVISIIALTIQVAQIYENQKYIAWTIDNILNALGG